MQKVLHGNDFLHSLYTGIDRNPIIKIVSTIPDYRPLSFACSLLNSKSIHHICPIFPTQKTVMNLFRAIFPATLNDDAFHAKPHQNHSTDERRSSSFALDTEVSSRTKDSIDNETVIAALRPTEDTPKRRSQRLQDKAGAIHNVSKLEAAVPKKGTRLVSPTVVETSSLDKAGTVPSSEIAPVTITGIENLIQELMTESFATLSPFSEYGVSFAPTDPSRLDENVTSAPPKCPSNKGTANEQFFVRERSDASSFANPLILPVSPPFTFFFAGITPEEGDVTPIRWTHGTALSPVSLGVLNSIQGLNLCTETNTTFSPSRMSDCSEFAPPHRWSPINKAATPNSNHDTSNDNSTYDNFFAKNNAGDEETWEQFVLKSVPWTPHPGSLSVTELPHPNEECTILSPEVSTFTQRHGIPGPSPPSKDVSNFLQQFCFTGKKLRRQ
jgi:hypothetical protein